MELLILFGAAGLLAGFLGGLLGIGGGLVLVPVLAAVFSAQHVDPTVLMPLTMGTSLASIVFTSLSSVRAHHLRGAVDWTLVRRLAPGLAVGATLGGLLSSRLPAAVAQTGFVVFAAYAATQLLFGSQKSACRALPGDILLTATASGMGLIAGSLGMGAATLTVPFLTWCSVSVRTSIGCASAFGLPIALAGTATYIACGLHKSGLPPMSLGFVHLPALAAVVAASMLAAPFGAAVSHRLPVSALRKVFAISIYAAAGKMLVAAM
jgi:uncharacterized membrane protein YfcA